MERIKVTTSALKGALIAAVAEKGDDYVYTNPDGESATGAAAQCYYVHHTNGGSVPGCLVGNALHRLGVPLAEFERHELRGAFTVAKDLIEITDASGEAERDSVYRMLSEVQDAQDNGAMWGDALAYAGVVTRVGDDA